MPSRQEIIEDIRTARAMLDAAWPTLESTSTEIRYLDAAIKSQLLPQILAFLERERTQEKSVPILATPADPLVDGLRQLMKALVESLPALPRPSSGDAPGALRVLEEGWWSVRYVKKGKAHSFRRNLRNEERLGVSQGDWESCCGLVLVRASEIDMGSLEMSEDSERRCKACIRNLTYWANLHEVLAVGRHYGRRVQGRYQEPGL